MRNLYGNGVRVKGIANQVARTRASIEKMIQRLGLADRKGKGGLGTDGSVQTYFDSIDTPMKAYFIGFLLADGNLFARSRERGLQVELAEKDRVIIDLMKGEFGGRIYFRVSRQSIILRVSGIRIFQSLVRAGVLPRKTLRMEWPGVSDDFSRFIVLGYSDGDGCIFRSKKSVGWSLTGATKEFLVVISEKIREGCGVILRPPRLVTGKTWVIGVHGNRKAGRLLDWIYSGHSIGLQRKREVAFG